MSFSILEYAIIVYCCTCVMDIVKIPVLEWGFDSLRVAKRNVEDLFVQRFYINFSESIPKNFQC